jgi:diguanylate cyclase (GGDEF)-like protein
MSKNGDSATQLEDIIEVDDHALSLAEIETIANDEEARLHYENNHTGCLYSIILRSLTHESFSEKRALTLWQEIISHMQRLNRILGRNVGVAVASLDYLSNVRDTLSEPKIIEEHKSKFVAEATTKDVLTSLYLREVFDVFLKKEVDEANRKNSQLSLLMVDIDDFKEINDTYGHLTGDIVLKKIGSAIHQSVRQMDLAVRYGGEEMAIIMPNTDIENATQIGERIRQKIEKLPFEKFTVTVSMGVSEIDKHVNTPEMLIKAADMALYTAKAKGKNCITKADDHHMSQHLPPERS